MWKTISAGRDEMLSCGGFGRAWVLEGVETCWCVTDMVAWALMNGGIFRLPCRITRRSIHV